MVQGVEPSFVRGKPFYFWTLELHAEVNKASRPLVNRELGVEGAEVLGVPEIDVVE